MEPNDKPVFAIPPVVFYLIIGGSTVGGLGGGLTLSPQLDRAAITQCFDNSQTALDVAAQHGAELQGLRTRISNIEATRHTRDEANRDSRDRDREHEIIRRRLELLEK